MRLANDRKMTLEQTLLLYGDELELWEAFDNTIGLEDIHLDLSVLNYNFMRANAKDANAIKFDDYLMRQRVKPSVKEQIDALKSMYAMPK